MLEGDEELDNSNMLFELLLGASFKRDLLEYTKSVGKLIGVEGDWRVVAIKRFLKSEGSHV